MESIENPFNGAPNFGKKVTCTIQRNGDLIHRIYLQATLPQVSLLPQDGSGAQFRWLNWVGHNLISYVELEIGGQRIDKHYGDWLHIWNELTQEAGKQAGYAKMVGNVPQLTNLIYQNGVPCDNDCYAGAPSLSEKIGSCAPMYTLYIPLQFWFCRNPGLALPLIALQYHEVRINLEFNSLNNLCWDYSNSSDPHAVRNRVAQTGLAAASLYVDYIYLDTDERRKFAQVSHEYLIDVLQFTGGESVTSSSTSTTLVRSSSGSSSATHSSAATTALSAPTRASSPSTTQTGGTARASSQATPSRVSRAWRATTLRSRRSSSSTATTASRSVRVPTSTWCSLTSTTRTSPRWASTCTPSRSSPSSTSPAARATCHVLTTPRSCLRYPTTPSASTRAPRYACMRRTTTSFA